MLTRSHSSPFATPKLRASPTYATPTHRLTWRFNYTLIVMCFISIITLLRFLIINDCHFYSFSFRVEVSKATAVNAKSVATTPQLSHTNALAWVRTPTSKLAVRSFHYYSYSHLTHSTSCR
jgi:hypothetical protein